MNNRITDEEWERTISTDTNDAEQNGSRDFYEAKLVRKIIKKRNDEISKEREKLDLMKLKQIQNKLELQGLIKESLITKIKRYIQRNYGGFGLGLVIMYIASTVFTTQNMAYRGSELEITKNIGPKVELKSYKYSKELESDNPKIAATLLLNEVINMNKVGIVVPNEEVVEIYVNDMTKNPDLMEIKFKEGLNIPFNIEGVIKIIIKQK